MRNAQLIGTLAVMLLVIAGCTTSNSYHLPRPLVYATNNPGQPRIDKPWVQEFTSTEPIGIVVDLPRGCGYGERTSTITVVNNDTGEQIASWTRHMREGQNHVFPLTNPSPGTYQISLTYEDSDSPRTTETFVVR